MKYFPACADRQSQENLNVCIWNLLYNLITLPSIKFKCMNCNTIHACSLFDLKYYFYWLPITDSTPSSFPPAEWRERVVWPVDVHQPGVCGSVIGSFWRGHSFGPHAKSTGHTRHLQPQSTGEGRFKSGDVEHCAASTNGETHLSQSTNNQPINHVVRGLLQDDGKIIFHSIDHVAAIIS